MWRRSRWAGIPAGQVSEQSLLRGPAWGHMYAWLPLLWAPSWILLVAGSELTSVPLFPSPTESHSRH